MAPLQQLAGLLGLSVVSGVNLYLTVLVVGCAQRFHWVVGLPTELQVLAHPLVLGVSGGLFLLEFLADKVPFVTPVWDAVHTFIRPVGGALLALASVGQVSPALQVAAAVAGGTIALGAHGTKMGVRLLAHATPEPASHSLLSLAEDLGVVGLLMLAYAHPRVALPILLAILLAIAWLLPLVFRVAGFLVAVLAARIRTLLEPQPRAVPPRWVALRLLELEAPADAWAGRAFARRVKGVPRLKPGYLVRLGDRWAFLHRGWFRTKAVWMDEGRPQPARLDPRVLWDEVLLLRAAKVQVLLLPKGSAIPPSTTTSPGDPRLP